MSGAIGTRGWNEVDSLDCTDTEYDVTNRAYNWRSLNPAVVTLTNPYTNFVGVGSTNGYSSIELESNRRLCPVQTYNPGNTQNTAQVKITSADITQNNVTVVLSASSGISGNLSVTLNGASSVSLANANLGPGTYNYTFPRTSLGAGEYTSLDAT